MISTQRLRRRLGDESGQTTFFVLCSFLTFFMFFALVANVGQAVNRRVLLQMVADTGAFSGASAQATGLNTISTFNKVIDDAWDVTTVLMLGWTIQYCGLDEAITRIYQAIETIMSTLIRVTNTGGAVWAIMEAEMVTRRNIRQLFPDGTVHSPLESFPSLLDSPGSMGMGASHIYNVNQAWPSLFSGVQLVRLKQKDATKNWTCYAYPATFTAKSRNFKLSWEKEDDDEVTRFYWWVTADPVDTLVLPKTDTMPFGFPQLPQMTAVALAKPIGGDIEPGGEGAKYVARMIPLSIIDAKFLNLGGSLPNLTEVLH
ncbi:MAG: hypothetical protein BMS9Abin37_2001 [Acidobacteriota bacterium]|nr:MAG: hypothetical protein BMS9Abin37_2001 [Acidobacteriota bacterium]